jgi:hypothetical protein
MCCCQEAGFSEADLQIVQTSSLVSQGNFAEAVELSKFGNHLLVKQLEALLVQLN